MIKSFKDVLKEIERINQVTWKIDHNDPDDLAHEYILRWGDVVELAEEYDLVKKVDTDKDRLKEILEQKLTYQRDEYGQWTTFSISDEQGNKITQRMRWIEPGTFMMGSPEDEPERYDGESPQHKVTLSQGFWLFDTACTQALWQAIMGSNPSRFKEADRPVENVSWNDCQDFLKKLNERLPGLDLTLPTEAQWEYACRAGTTTPFSFGDNITPEQVNYDGNRGGTVPVASLPPNPWGLYQMHGNVWEWTQDYWHDNYQGAPADGSAWVSAAAGAKRVIRGGSWFNYARYVRAAYRDLAAPGYRGASLGFRCARV